MDTTNAVPMFTLFTAAPTTITEGCKVLSFNRKSTKDNPVPDTEKVRYWLQPNYPELEVNTLTGPNATLHAALVEVLDSTAKKLVQAAFMADPKQEQLPRNIIEWNSILAALEESSTKESLTGASILAWYDASETGKQNATRYGTDKDAEAKAKMLRSKYGSMASNNPDVSPTLAGKMLAYMVESDLQHSIARAIVKRLEVRSSKTSDADNL